MIPASLTKEKIPKKPGVYLFKDNQGKIIYVGKALDLYSRVSSYFNLRSHMSSGNTKTVALVSEIQGLETIIVSSEMEALILEANLIKKNLPKFNIRLTDDKDYLYIKITNEQFPKIVTARKQDLKTALRYFGPFPSSTTVKSTLRTLRSVFPWCSGSYQKNKPCFYKHLELCPGSCANLIDKLQYKKIINRFIKFMEGKKEQLVNELTKEMEQKADQQRFEEAQGLKKTLEGINYLTQSNRVEVFLENPNFLEDQRKIALEKLQQVLNLSKIPERIECYDISNIQGHDATGSMVVLTNGETDKTQYRRFKIQISGKPNDFAMMAEMIRRRMKNNWTLPDLIIIDGGKGQISAVLDQINKTGKEHFKKTPIFGLAKRMEWLYGVDGTIYKLSKSNPALRLVQRIRDEAHRFAITYHRKLHRRSVLQDVIS